VPTGNLQTKVKKAVAEAATIEDLHAALLPVIDNAATPDLVPKGAMVLQPSEERRRSGSHYTPRELTGPIVSTTLEPILTRLRGADGRPPRPAQILELKVCDPAMGSGAFLVEACRQLGDALVEAWRTHEEMPAIPPDEVGGWLRSAAYTAWIATQWPLTLPRFRFGWLRWRKTMHLPSWTMRCGTGILWSDYLEHRLRHFIGTQMRRGSRLASRQCEYANM